MALGPEAWFVWRRTVFPDYLLEAVVSPDVLARPAICPSTTPCDRCARRSGPLLSRLQRWDQRHYLPDDILVKVDRATMAHSLEARCPLLDHQVIELAASQPSARHGDSATTKRLFREVIRPWVPADVLTRPKRGFGVPLRRWFQEGLTPGRARSCSTRGRGSAAGRTRREVTALLRAARAGHARSRQAHLGAGLPRAVGAPSCRSEPRLADAHARDDAGAVPRDDARRRRDAASGVDARARGARRRRRRHHRPAAAARRGARIRSTGVPATILRIAVPARRRVSLAAHARIRPR